eukprot:c28631_g1_i2 orf=709-3417(-)
MFPWLKLKKGNKENSQDASRNGHDRLGSGPRKLDRAQRLHSNLRHPVDEDSSDRSRGSQHSDLSSEVVLSSAWGSRSPSPSNPVFRSSSNADQYVGKPLPQPPTARCISGNESLVYSPSQYFSAQPLSSPHFRGEGVDVDGGTSGYATDSISSDGSLESIETKDSRPRQGLTHSPYRRSSEGDIPRHSPVNGTEDVQVSSNMFPSQRGLRSDLLRPGSPLPTPSSTERVAFKSGQGEGSGELHIHIHVNGVHGSASNSTFSSPVPSPQAIVSSEPPWQNFWNTTQDHPSPTSLHSSVHNSTIGDLQLNLQQEKISPKMSPLHSPRKSPHLSPRRQSRDASPIHLRGSVTSYDSSTYWSDEQRYAHPLPLPPSSNMGPAVSSPMSPRPLLPRSPGRAEPAVSSGKWIKGQLLGSGSFGKVYRGIHSETGDMCAIKEVELVSDDPKSKESAKQLEQEIAMLSTLRHPNIVHYKGSEMVGDNLYIYLELVSGGSIYRLVKEFKRLKEPVIQRYTRQILQGLHYLHSKNTVHRDIKGANILVDHDGRIKLADFGMAKHVEKEASPLSFKGSPYWMAPEVIMQNNTGYEFAVDIWSLGCTVIEMVTGKPPWSEYEGVAAMFKVTRCDSPPIPNSFSSKGKDFVRLCLQKNPAERPTAAMLLEHAFVQIPTDGSDPAIQSANAIGALGLGKGSTHKEVEGYSPSIHRGNLRQSPLGASPLVHVRQACQSKLPSLSAPVSPRLSHQAYSGASPTRSTALLSGFSTPPTGGEIRLLSMGYEAYGLPVNQPSGRHGNAIRSSNTTQGNALTSQMVNHDRRGDFQWATPSDRSHILQDYIHGEKDGVLSGYNIFQRNTEHDHPFSTYPWRLDEQVTQQLLRRPPQIPARLFEHGSPMGSRMVSRTDSHELNY